MLKSKDTCLNGVFRDTANGLSRGEGRKLGHNISRRPRTSLRSALWILGGERGDRSGRLDWRRGGRCCSWLMVGRV